MRTISRTERPKAAFHIHPWSVAAVDQHVLAFHRGVFSDAIVDERIACLRCRHHVDQVGRFEGHTYSFDVTTKNEEDRTRRGAATGHKFFSCFFIRLPFAPVRSLLRSAKIQIAPMHPERAFRVINLLDVPDHKRKFWPQESAVVVRSKNREILDVIQFYSNAFTASEPYSRLYPDAVTFFTVVGELRSVADLEAKIEWSLEPTTNSTYILGRHSHQKE